MHLFVLTFPVFGVQTDIIEIQELLLQEKDRLDTSVKNSLKLAKYYLVNGNFEKADFFLKQINPSTTPLYPIYYNYKAFLQFAQNKFSDVIKTLNVLEHKSILPLSISQQGEVCIIKIASFLALKKHLNMNKEINKCIIYTKEYSKTNHYWLKGLSNFFNRRNTTSDKEQFLSYINSYSNNEMTKLWLKFAIFTDREDFILPGMLKIPLQAYRSKRIRELLGFIYFQQGDNKLAFDFTEDLHLPNAEIVKGSLELLKKANELAFGHYNIALSKNPNSLMALTKAIPLAWKLKQWEQGYKLISSVPTSNLFPRTKIAIQTAFLIQMDNLAMTEGNLRLLQILFKNFTPFKINLISSYIALMNNDRPLLEIHSGNACRKLDGISCWIYMNTINWNNLGEIIKRDRPIIEKTEFSIEDLKKDVIIRPIVEDSLLTEDIILNTNKI